MQSRHLQFLRYAHHVAGSVEETAHTEVQLIVEGGLAAAVVA